MTREVCENDCAKFKREIRNQIKEYRKGRDKRRDSNLMLKHDQIYEAEINCIHTDDNHHDRFLFFLIVNLQILNRDISFFIYCEIIIFNSQEKLIDQIM